MNTTTALPQSERFHALDATRAFALLLGVVFHAVWFYAYGPLGTAVKDVSANHFFSWFFHTSHTFRMQLFFLIAGFFARLVCERRGVGNFTRNRLIRIGIPFVLGWMILIPLLRLDWVWGMSISGQLPADLPVFKTVWGQYTSGSIFIDKSKGGSFSYGHLWFLYYLLLLYLITLTGRTLLLRTPLNRDWFLDRIDRFVRFLVGSPLGALVLALLLTPVIWSMASWMGIDTPGSKQLPIMRVVIAYLVFFLLGWWVHRQAHELRSFFRQWRFYLATALVASVGLYLFFLQVRPYEPARPAHAISHRDIQDWPAFRASIARGADSSVDQPLAQLWSALSPHIQGYILAKSITFDQRSAILYSINGVLADPAYLTADFQAKEPRKIDLSAIQAHRESLHPYLEGISPGDYREENWYQPVKLAYSALYCVIMIFLVFGCLGAFQAACNGHSPTWRYLADSSYWIYLLHLPLVVFLETLIYQWPITAWIKLPLLSLVSLIILYASYHYLVRSTMIGKLLNGRAHPFYWNPLRTLGLTPDRKAAAALQTDQSVTASIQ